MEPRFNLTISVPNVSQAEAETVLQLVHRCGFPAEITNMATRWLSPAPASVSPQPDTRED